MGQGCCRRPANDVGFAKGLPPATSSEFEQGRDFESRQRPSVSRSREPWAESEDSRIAPPDSGTRDALLYDEGMPRPPAVVKEGDSQGFFSPAGCPVRCLTYCCCCLLLLPLLAYLLLVQLNFTVYGTSFTYSNYYRPLWNYLVAGMADTVSLTDWYDGMTNGDPFVGEGPGPNTFMYYGWSEVRSLLEGFGPRVRNGTSKRYNELGVSIQNIVMWPEVGTVELGFSNVAHSIVRPFLASALDAARRPTETCDGSTCWNAPWLHRMFKERFATMDTFSSADLKWIVTVVLHKIHMNLDISDEDAKKFGAWMPLFLLPQPLPEAVVTSWPGRWLIGVDGILDFKAGLIETYKQAIHRKWPEEGWDSRPNDLLLLASAMVDSLALFGGLTVPTVLDFMLAMLYMKDSPALPLKPSELTDATVLHDFLLETLRRFPPVTGMPHWVTNDAGTTWVHHVPNVGQALQDPRVFPRPLEFVPGRPGLNHQDQTLSIGWADFALVNGDVSNPDSHACPAKQLSVQVMAAFMQEFVAAGPWQVENPDIKLHMYSSSGFTLRKQQVTVEEGPSVKVEAPSVPFPDTPDSPLLRLCGWMPSVCKANGINLQCMEGPCAFS